MTNNELRAFLPAIEETVRLSNDYLGKYHKREHRYYNSEKIATSLSEMEARQKYLEETDGERERQMVADEDGAYTALRRWLYSLDHDSVKVIETLFCIGRGVFDVFYDEETEEFYCITDVSKITFDWARAEIGNKQPREKIVEYMLTKLILGEYVQRGCNLIGLELFCDRSDKKVEDTPCYESDECGVGASQ